MGKGFEKPTIDKFENLDLGSDNKPASKSDGS